MTPFRTLLSVSIAAAAVLAVPTFASAEPAPRLDPLLRPCFGVLTKPAIKDCDDGRYRRYRDGYDSRYRAGAIHVSCDRYPNGRPIAAALKRVKAGGVIVVHAVDRACTESLYITKSVWIQSDSGGDRISGATLRPGAGLPCVRIAPGVRDVKLSGLTIDASAAGAASCIEASDTDLLITDTRIRYEGEGSAVKATGGRLRFGMGSAIRARTSKGAIETEGAILEIADAAISASFTALDVTPGPGVNQIKGLRVRATNDWSDDATAGQSTGVVVRGGGEGWMRFEDTAICGHRTGLWADRGAAVAFLGAKVCRAEIGFVSQGAKLRVQGTDIGASDTGIYAIDGVVELYKSRIYGVSRSSVYTDGGARLAAEENRMYPRDIPCSQIDGRLLKSGVLCRSWDELPEFYMEERQAGKGRFDDDTRYFGVDSSWGGGHERGDFGWSDDWGGPSRRSDAW